MSPMPVADLVRPFIDQLLRAPLPYVDAGADARAYLEIERARAEAATAICQDALTIVESIQGEDAVKRAREDLEPIRQRLVDLFPHVGATLDRDVWPGRAAIH